MTSTGAEMMRTAFHSSQFSGTIWKMDYVQGREGCGQHRSDQQSRASRTYGEGREVENEEVKGHRERDGSDEVRVGPEGEHEEGLVLAERVARVEHLDDWKVKHQNRAGR